jgi:hypothetical protein
VRTFLALCILGLAPLASAQLVIDQHNEVTPAYPLALGGSSEQALAQVLHVGQSGPLAKVRLHIGCDPSSHGRVRVEIQSAGLLRPDGDLHVLDSVERDVASFGAEPGPEGFPLSGVWFDAGARIAVVVRASEGVSCGLLASESPPSYPSGYAFYDARPNPPGWLWLDRSLLFATFVRLDEESCRFHGASGANGFVPAFVPVCRCLEDRILATHRCSFQLPDFVVAREVPMWSKPDFVARWVVIPLGEEAPMLRVESHGVDTWLGGEVLKVPAGTKPMQVIEQQTKHWTKSGPPALTRFDIEVGDTRYRFEAPLTP